jgi:biopolymer transport protein ExbD
MARRHHYRRRSKELTELDVTTFLNLMVVLVPFLLITAVFSRLAVVELHLPSAAISANTDAPPFQLEVIVRAQGLELTNGSSVIAALPKAEDEYDLVQLGDYVYSLKQEYPDSNAASVLMEPEIPYDYLIQVMDVVRAVEMPAAEEGGEPVMLALFDQISVGSAP